MCVRTKSPTHHNIEPSLHTLRGEAGGIREYDAILHQAALVLKFIVDEAHACDAGYCVYREERGVVQSKIQLVLRRAVTAAGRSGHTRGEQGDIVRASDMIIPEGSGLAVMFQS